MQVTHDPEKAHYSNRIIRLRDGHVEEEERITSPTQAPISTTDFSFLADEEDKDAGT